MTERAVTRRTVLVGGMSTALVAGLGVVACRSSSDETSPTRTTLEPASTDLVDLVVPIGLAYREQTPEEDDEALLSEMLPGLEGLTAAAAVGSLPTLDSAVAADFEEGRTVEVAGWVLSRTEARAAALISLMQR